MDDAQVSQLSIQVACDGATDEELDRMTRQLLSLLRETEIDSAELTRGEAAPAGSKGDPITIGSIAVQALPTLLPGVVSLVQSWMSSGPGRTVKFKSKDFEFEGSPDELQKLLKTFNRNKVRK